MAKTIKIRPISNYDYIFNVVKTLSEKETDLIFPVLKEYGVLPNNTYSIQKIEISDSNAFKIKYTIYWIANDGTFFYNKETTTTINNYKEILRDLKLNKLNEDN